MELGDCTESSNNGCVVQDFKSVVESAKLLYIEGKQPCGGSTHLALSEPVYGRICTSKNKGPPLALTADPSRKTAFIFGPDAITSIVLRHSAYDTLLRLGFTRDYLYYDVVVRKCTSWLFLFKPAACLRDDFLIAPATWGGVENVLRVCYPDALRDFEVHRPRLLNGDYGSFEREAGFKFLQSKEAGDAPSGADVGAPPYCGYEYFRCLPAPRKAWQVRLFLYCELRLLELFSGDGRTCAEDGGTGCMEYLCTNVGIADFDPLQCALIPLDVQVPVA